MLVVLLTILSLLCILEWFLNRRERAYLFWKIQGPAGSLLFGNCLYNLLLPQVIQLFINLRRWAADYKGYYRQWIYPYGVLHIYNPDDIETIISNPNHNEKSILYDFLRPWLHDGLLLSKGSKWLVRRRILTPAFHFNILQHFAAIIEENSLRLIKVLDDNETCNDKTDVVPFLSDVTLNAICETSMGTKLDEDASGEGKTYKSAIYEIGKLIIYRIARSWLVFDFIWNMTKEGKRQQHVLKVIHNFPTRIIEERRHDIEKYGVNVANSSVTDDGYIGPYKRRMAMLDLLISAQKDGLIDATGIQEEVDTFMFEGHDTTSMGLTYALMEIANHKEIQERIVAEIEEIFADSNRVASMVDLSKLKYLECCIKEVLRLYPPVPFISRFISTGVKLGGHDIPPGNTLCHIHIFDLHRRADLYEDPLQFKPERFTAENSAHRHPYAYIPFSGGPRNCIGQKFAMLEMKSVISAILRRFELHPVTSAADLQFTTDLVLRTTHPVYVKFSRRSKYMKWLLK